MNTNNIHFRGEIRKIGKGVFNIKSYAIVPHMIWLVASLSGWDQSRFSRV